ncbi:hypothetical protein SCLCIDRAFT_123554, partial [Scleroderma citrinum Foug A]
DSVFQSFCREVHIWSKLDHINVLSVLGFTDKFDQTISIVTPWMEMGNAHDYVQNVDVDPCPLLVGIAAGLQYLHSYEPHPIYHGDLKGVNVLISDDGCPLLADFGTPSSSTHLLVWTLKAVGEEPRIGWPQNTLTHRKTLQLPKETPVL